MMHGQKNIKLCCVNSGTSYCKSCRYRLFGTCLSKDQR